MGLILLHNTGRIFAGESNDWWLINFEVEDEYDFEQKTYADKTINFSASNTINDVGWIMQETGQLQKYPVKFSGGFLY